MNARPAHRLFARVGGIALAVGLAGSSGCFIGQVSAIEVLPPRTNALCSAAGASAGALSRGLLDVQAVEDYHGAYVADLRLSAYQDVVVDALGIAVQFPGDDSPGEFTDYPVGDLFLKGSGDDARSAILENVTLFTRENTEQVRDDDLDIDRTQYETAIIHIEARREGGVLLSDTATFSLDLCDGCLLTKPDEDDCGELGIAENPVCRGGQDVEHFSCAVASSSPF